VEDASMGGRVGKEENVGGRGRRKRMPADSVIAPTNRTKDRRRMARSERLERRGPGYIGDHTNLANAAVGRRWVAAVLNKLVQELLQVSSRKRTAVLGFAREFALGSEDATGVSGSLQILEPARGKTRDRPQTRQMQQTQQYDQHQSNACPVKMH